MTIYTRVARGVALLVVTTALNATYAQAQDSNVILDGRDIGRSAAPPSGWFSTGNAIACYEIFSDVGSGAPFGKRFARIASHDPMMIGSHTTNVNGCNKGTDTSRFATLMQSIGAENYRGKRVRLSARLSTFDVNGSAGLWMRVDAQNGKVLAFDNMESRKLVGTKSWQRYDIVLDVPADSASISFGFLLAGNGQVNATEFTFEPVDGSIATTATPFTQPERNLPSAPVNLDFHP